MSKVKENVKFYVVCSIILLIWAVMAYAIIPNLQHGNMIKVEATVIKVDKPVQKMYRYHAKGKHSRYRIRYITVQSFSIKYKYKGKEYRKDFIREKVNASIAVGDKIKMWVNKKSPEKIKLY